MGTSTKKGIGTCTPNYPTTPGAFQPAFHQGEDVIVTKLNPAGSDLVYRHFSAAPRVLPRWTMKATPLPWTPPATRKSPAARPRRFPSTPGAFQTGPPAEGNAGAVLFLRVRYQINTTGTGLVYSAYRRQQERRANGIAIDSAGNAYVVEFSDRQLSDDGGRMQPSKRGSEPTPSLRR